MNEVEKLKKRIQRLEKNNAELFLIVDATKRVSTLDSGVIVNALLRACKEITGARKCYFLTSNWKCFELDSGELREVSLEDHREFYEKVVSHREAVVEKEGKRAKLGIPLILEDKVVGVIQAEDIPFPEHAEEYISTMSFIAGPAAIGLKNVFLLDELRSKENELKKSATFIKTIINSVGDPLLVIDPATYRIVLANKAAIDLIGGKDPSKMSLFCYQISHQRDSPCNGPDEPCPIKEVISTKAPVRVTHVHHDAEGNELYIDIIATPVFDKKGKVVQIIESIREITELKKAENELKKYARDLEHSNKLKDLFTDIMRHDLLNPAGVVRGATELLLDELPDREELKMIKRSVDKLIAMIESASKLSKLESAKELEKESIDVKEIIERVVEENKSLLEKAGLKVENNVKDAIKIKANPVIEDIFLNFLSNAAKYAAEGGKVVIDAVDEGESVKVMIKDYGPGIPDEAKKNIFERFTRRDKVRGVKGTGLGLAIAKRIVDLHNGEIWVEDNPEGGSVFIVRLPKR